MNDLCIIILFVFNVCIAIALVYALLLLKIKKKKEKTIEEGFNPFGKDFYKGIQEQYVRIPFVPYKKGTNFCEIGDFIMQWGTSDSTDFLFNVKFKDCFGVFIMPYKGGGGNEAYGIKNIDGNRVHVIAAKAERPYYWFAFGSKIQDKETEEVDKNAENINANLTDLQKRLGPQTNYRCIHHVTKELGTVRNQRKTVNYCARYKHIEDGTEISPDDYNKLWRRDLEEDEELTFNDSDYICLNWRKIGRMHKRDVCFEWAHKITNQRRSL